MIGEALVHGAATIVNAIATGKGAAFGVDLWTRARVQLTDKPGIIESTIRSDPKESGVLVVKCVERVFENFDVKSFGAKVETRSNVPIAKGLKSSSTAANAIVLATVSALKENLSDDEIVNLSVDAALSARVSITGAFDDASASYYGSVAVTDNAKRRVLRAFPIEDLHVALYVPNEKSYTSKIDVERMKLVAKQVEVAFEKALSGDIWNAMILNGLVCSAALGYSTMVVMETLEAGAISAGLSGKGPAIAVVSAEEDLKRVLKVLQRFPGETILAKTNREKARIIE